MNTPINRGFQLAGLTQLNAQSQPLPTFEDSDKSEPAPLISGVVRRFIAVGDRSQRPMNPRFIGTGALLQIALNPDKIGAELRNS